jgi:hypothetical protein
MLLPTAAEEEVHDGERRGGRRAVVVVIISRVQGMDGTHGYIALRGGRGRPLCQV